MLTIRAMSDGTGYSARHLQHGDYHAEGECVTGQLQGRGAEILGLAGEVQADQFDALRHGLDPQSGEFFRPRQIAKRFRNCVVILSTASTRWNKAEHYNFNDLK